MYALYLRFVEQVKQEEINTYNERHRDYLIRAGKMQPPPNSKQARPINPRQKKEPARQNHQENTYAARNSNLAPSAPDQRPLKGSDSYNIPQDQFAKDVKPIHPQNKNIQKRPIAQSEQPKVKAEARMASTPIEQPPIQQPVQRTRVKQQLPIPKISKEINQQPPEFEQVVLVECPEGCGKKFNERALQKHVRLCGKGEVKRKVFHAKVVDDEALQLKKEEKGEKKEAKEIPKWKMESNRFRNAINNQKALESGAPPPPVLPEVDERVECPSCGRKFNAEPAAKHIPNCLRRNGKK